MVLRLPLRNRICTCSELMLFLEDAPQCIAKSVRSEARKAASSERIKVGRRRKDWLLESCFRLQNNVRERVWKGVVGGIYLCCRGSL
jgi:replicative DNA helicase